MNPFPKHIISNKCTTITTRNKRLYQSKVPNTSTLVTLDLLSSFSAAKNFLLEALKIWNLTYETTNKMKVKKY
jgi:hypothetical protein